jgi:hypothetical protein
MPASGAVPFTVRSAESPDGGVNPAAPAHVDARIALEHAPLYHPLIGLAAQDDPVPSAIADGYVLHVHAALVLDVDAVTELTGAALALIAFTSNDAATDHDVCLCDDMEHGVLARSSRRRLQHGSGR